MNFGKKSETQQSHLPWSFPKTRLYTVKLPSRFLISGLVSLVKQVMLNYRKRHVVIVFTVYFYI